MPTDRSFMLSILMIHIDSALFLFIEIEIHSHQGHQDEAKDIDSAFHQVKVIIFARNYKFPPTTLSDNVINIIVITSVWPNHST